MLRGDDYFAMMAFRSASGAAIRGRLSIPCTVRAVAELPDHLCQLPVLRGEKMMRRDKRYGAPSMLASRFIVGFHCSCRGSSSQVNARIMRCELANYEWTAVRPFFRISRMPYCA